MEYAFEGRYVPCHADEVVDSVPEAAFTFANTGGGVYCLVAQLPGAECGETIVVGPYREDRVPEFLVECESDDGDVTWWECEVTIAVVDAEWYPSADWTEETGRTTAEVVAAVRALAMP